MPDYAVSTSFLGKDKVSAVFSAMERAAARYGDSASSSVRKVGDAADHSSQALRNATKHGYNFGAIVKGILAANAIRGGLGLIGSGVRTAVVDFIDFDHAMTGAAARFDDIGPKAVDFKGKLSALKQGVRDAIAGTPFTAVEAGKGMDSLAKAGFTSTAAVGILRSQLELAAATGGDFQTSLQQSNELLGAFGLRSMDSQQTIRNQIKLNDVLGAAANAANGDLSDLYEALKMAAPVARIHNAAMEDVVAMAVALDNAGIRGSEGATAIKNALLNLSRADVQAELMANGIDIRIPGTNDMRKFSAILGDMTKRMKELHLGTIPTAQIFDRIFQRRAIAGAKNLTDNLAGLAKIEEQMRGATGANKEMSDVISNDTLNQLNKLKNAAIEAGFKLFEAFEVKGKGGIESLTAGIKGFDMKPIIEGLSAAGNVLGLVYKILEPFLPILPYLISGFLLITRVIMPLIAAAGWIWGWVTAISAAIAEFGIFGALVAGGGLIVAGVLAVVAVITYLQAKFHLFTRMFKWAGEVIVKVWDYVLQKLRPVFDLVTLLLQSLGSVIGYLASPLIQGAKSILGLDNPQNFDAFMRGLGGGLAEAPNMQEAQARRMQFSGQLNIAGAPAGSTFESHVFGMPQLDVNMLGAQ